MSWLWEMIEAGLLSIAFVLGVAYLFQSIEQFISRF